MPIVNERAFGVTAATNFFVTPIQPTTSDGWLTITIVSPVAGLLSVIHDDGTNEDEGILFNGVALVAGAEYSFQVPCPTNVTPPLAKESINFRFSVTTTLTKLIILEGA